MCIIQALRALGVVFCFQLAGGGGMRLESIKKGIDKCERLLTGCSAVLMAVLSLVICWQVFARYLLKQSPYWVEEFSVTALMWVGLLGAASAVWSKDHMSLELVVKRLPKKWGTYLEIVIDLVICAFSVFLFSQGRILVNATMRSMMSTMPFSLGATYIVLPIAGIIMVFFSAAHAVLKLIHLIADGHEKGKE